MHTGVYLQKSAKGLIPTALWELILKHNTSGMGVVSATSDNKSVQVQSGVGKPEIAELEAFQKEYLDRAVLFYLYEATEGFKTEDIQPFTILTDDKENPLLAVLLDGAFERHVEDNGHTPEYNAAFEYLHDRMTDLYAIAHGDLGKVMDLMRVPRFIKELTAVIGEGNSVTMLAATGEIMSFGPVKDIRKEPWGWSTNYYGFGEKKIEAPPAKVEEKKTGMAALFGKDKKVNNPPAQTLQAVAVTPKVEDKGPGLQETNAKLSTSTATGADELNKEIWVIPDETIQSNNKKGNWYHNLSPSLDRDAWKVPNGAAPLAVKTTKAELIRLKISRYKIVPAPTTTSTQEYRGFASQKDTESHNVPQPTAAKPVDAVTKTTESLVSVIPRAPSDEAMRVTNIVQNSKGVIDPEQFKAMERKYPTILDIAGLKHWDQLHKLDFDDIYKIAENRTAVSVMVMNLIGQHIRMSEKEKAVLEKAQQKIAM